MASTRVVCSRASAGRQVIHRKTTSSPIKRNVGSSLSSNAKVFRPSLQAPLRSGLSTGVLAVSTNAANGESSSSSSSKEGWASWEAAASTLLAVTATGSFLVGSTVSSPNFDPTEIFHRKGGGGGGGGSSGPPVTPLSKEDEKEKNQVATMESDSNKPYEVSIRAIRGGRLTMEDEYFVGDGGRFAAVFDGHGGGDVSALLRRQLFAQFSEILERNHELQPRNCISSQVAALRSAFQQIDAQVLADDTMQYQGSTAVAVMVHEGEDGHRTLLSANVGDSRAVLSRSGRAIDLTRDHKPNDEREKARIMAMGETIEWDHYCKVHRVKNLSLSRAIGDRFAKPVVTGEVEIKHFPGADDGQDEFFLLASDGLWDVMSSQDAVDFVHKRMNKFPRTSILGHEDSAQLRRARRQHMSDAVAKEALRLGSGDNVCVVIVWLEKNQEGNA